ncbi:hypothetical protein PBR20603_04218 [Pandoraea bronchicola]|uniref:Uncharacterized protein n=1 Tax=Pandoraea bronchicola TaxID=2508287 RepID=A0A5E5BXW4_9BURK|nr:hypothetical protein PBR20603_04218 [Pandoraea bronchicola]
MAVAGPRVARSHAGGAAGAGDCAADAAVCPGAGRVGNRSALAQCRDASGASDASGGRSAQWAWREGRGSGHALVCRTGTQKCVLRCGAHLASGGNARADPPASGGGRWRTDPGLGGPWTGRNRNGFSCAAEVGAHRGAGEPSWCAVSQASRAAPSRAALADVTCTIYACLATGDGCRRRRSADACQA